MAPQTGALVAGTWTDDLAVGHERRVERLLSVHISTNALSISFFFGGSLFVAHLLTPTPVAVPLVATMISTSLTAGLENIASS